MFQILPALESFCLYAAAGVFFTFIYQATFFVAFLVLDEHRVAKKKHPFLPCVTIENSTTILNERASCTRSLINSVYSKIIFTTPIKVLHSVTFNISFCSVINSIAFYFFDYYNK